MSNTAAALPTKVSSRSSSPERPPIPQPEKDEKKNSSAHVSPGGSPRKIEDHTAAPEKSVPRKVSGGDQPEPEAGPDLKDRKAVAISGGSDDSALELEELRRKCVEAATNFEEIRAKLVEAEKTVQELTAKVEAAPQATEGEIQEKQNTEQALKDAQGHVKTLGEQVSSLKFQKEELEEKVRTQHEALEGLRLTKEQIAKELQQVQNDAEKKAKDFKEKLQEAQQTGQELDALKIHASEIATSTVAAALHAKGVLELLEHKLEKVNRGKEEIAQARKALELEDQDQVKLSQELQGRATEVARKEQDLQARITEAGKFKQPVPGEAAPAPTSKVRSADISKPDSFGAAEAKALEYLISKFFSKEKLAIFKAEYDKIADDQSPRVTKESFANFLASEVSRAFGKAERALLDKAVVKAGDEKEILEHLKNVFLEKLQAGNIPDLAVDQEAQFISFVGAAVKAIENPVKLLKEAPDHSWRNRILRTFSVELLGGAGAFMYQGSILANLPQDALDLVSTISSTGSAVYQSSIEPRLTMFALEIVSHIKGYTGDPTVPLLCAVLVAVFYFIFDLIASRLLRQKAKTEDEVIQGLIAKNVQLVRV